MSDVRIKCINPTESKDQHVGIKFCEPEGKPVVEVTFPLGYNIEDIRDTEGDTDPERLKRLKKQKSETRALLSTIYRYTASRYSDEFYKSPNKKPRHYAFDAYITVIEDFLRHGYYIVREAVYKRAATGKINWKKTISRMNPLVTKSANAPIYTEFIVKKNEVQNDKIISLLHEWCVHEAFSKFGFLFTMQHVRIPSLRTKIIEDNEKYFITIIDEVLRTTFNDRNKRLFNAMKAMLSDANSEEGDEFNYGTEFFRVVWEGLVDRAFGISAIDKEQYFPPAEWKFVPQLKAEGKGNSLRPDTIMDIGDGNLFVLDAKYYPFMLNPKAVPSAADINKQVHYGAYAQSIDEAKTVYNAFVIPYDIKENKYELELGDETPFALIGSAYLMKNDAPDIDKVYKSVLGILIDTKWIMDKNGLQNEEDKEKLAEYIEKCYRDKIKGSCRIISKIATKSEERDNFK